MQHLIPVLQALLGAQQHAQRGDVTWPGAMQLAQDRSRFLETALVEQQFGLRGQPRIAQFVDRAFGASKPHVAPAGVAHEVRGASRQQRRQPRRGIEIVGARGKFVRSPEATFEIGLPGTAHRVVGLGFALSRTEGRDIRWQTQRVHHQSHDRISQCEQGHKRDECQRERHLDTPRRRDDQHVAFVHAREQAQPHGKRGHHQEPDQPAHGYSPLSPLDLSVRIMVRLSPRVGSCTSSVATEISLNAANAPLTRGWRASK